MRRLLLGGFVFLGAYVSYCWGQLDVRDGLLAEYRLDEVEGTTAKDSVLDNNLRYSGSTVAWQNPGVLFSAQKRENFTPINLYPDVREHFTLVARVRSDNTTAWRGVLDLESISMILIDGKVHLEVRQDPYGVNMDGSEGFGFTSSNASLEWGKWHHVAITNNGARTRIYIDGVLDREVVQRVIPNRPFDMKIGVRNAGAIDYFHGAISGVRVYGRELSPSEVGILFDPPDPDETMVGLWVGEVSLNEVREVSSGEWGAAPHPFSTRLLVQSNAVSDMKLLQEAIIVQTREDEPREAIVSQADLVANYDGVIPRGDEKIGLRFSSSTVTLPGDQLALGGTGNGEEVVATITLSASHPRNPFRHKYHPDLGVGRELVRTLRILWDEDDGPEDGVRKAVVIDVMDGIHKNTLEARGTGLFTRVSSSDLLNP